MVFWCLYLLFVLFLVLSDIVFMCFPCVPCFLFVFYYKTHVIVSNNNTHITVVLCSFWLFLVFILSEDLRGVARGHVKVPRDAAAARSGPRRVRPLLCKRVTSKLTQYQ